ncbi:uncharacterized protein C8Q71DRAFT_260516 [Rhodofomes roseus]|uniref:C2H2-type domain-containing protein n=1 Tax=Rhodofomes roseus TaxID=34475 RepID=A0ABQ8K672_9APHY|nr:uncharacterized protein C8Q71DRAFT_260516 [Rhodofomes roseus]KAH9832600.1 hypothetical protein C8Q71DRAFT_260516 [Rhodofomes roseus]
MVTDCVRCKEHFDSPGALADHLGTSKAHNVCRTCVMDFPLRLHLVQHFLFSPLHNYCQRCDNHFDSPAELVRHFESEHSQCLMCGLCFATPNDLNEHYHHTHWTCIECRIVSATPDAFDAHCRETHWYCADCKRVFKDGDSLRAHYESNIHKGRKVHCPGVKCSKDFVSSSALIQHLESGGCTSKMTRHDVKKLAVQMDKENIITDAARLLTGPGGSSVPRMTTTSWATELSKNPRTGLYECVICHAGFKKLTSLNNHLQSPVHDEKIYRCPQTWQGCGVEFNTLGALCQHVEKGNCGVHKFNNTLQKYVGSLADGMKRLAL